MNESLRIPIRRHTTDSDPVLVNRLAEVLKLLGKGITSEDVNHAHEVNVLLVVRKKATIIGLVEPLVDFFCVRHLGLDVCGAKSVER